MTHVLVPVAVLDGETISPTLIDALSEVTVTVLGYHVVPEQTSPDQARMQFEDRATEILIDMVDEFEAAGGTAYHRLVFTHDRAQSVNRVAGEIEADATLLLRPTPDIEELYIAIGSEAEIPLIGSTLRDIIGKLDAEIFLRYFLGADPTTAGGAPEEALETLAEQLATAGADADRIDSAVMPGERVTRPILDDAEGRGVDLVVVSDPDTTIGEFILGELEERLANQLLAPILVVQNVAAEQAKSDEQPE